MNRPLPSLAIVLFFAGCVFHENEQGTTPENPADPETGPGIDPGNGPGPQLDTGIPQSFGRTAQQYGGTVRLSVANNSQVAICKMFISPASDGSWGEDWLGPTEQITPGMTRVFGVAANDYDLQMTDCSGQGTTPGRTLGEHRALSVRADQVIEVN